MAFHESWVERQIREATERGEFDGLAGAGKPLDLHDVDDPDWWVKRFVAREGLDASATMPPVMQLRAEHAGFPASLVELTREDDVAEVLRDYNRRVVEDRLRPVVGRAMPVVAPRVDVETMVNQWRDLRKREMARRAAEDATHPELASDPPDAPRRRAWWRRWRGRVRPDDGGRPQE